MACIDQEYYKNSFAGVEIASEKDFNRLVDIAEDVLYSICNIKPDDEIKAHSVYKKAVCYQTELLYEQGGVDAILGFSESSLNGNSESLGDYSVSAGAMSQTALMTYNGIPVSPLAVMQLRNLGLMSRWAFSEYYRRSAKNGIKKNTK